MSDDNDRKRRTVLKLSVYNAVSLSRGALPVELVTELLRRSWAPAWGPVVEVVTGESVRAAAEALVSDGHCVINGGLVDARSRDRSGFGRMLRTNAARTELVPC